MTCGAHRAGDGSYHIKDMNGIPYKRVCDHCRKGEGSAAHDDLVLIQYYRDTLAAAVWRF